MRYLVLCREEWDCLKKPSLYCLNRRWSPPIYQDTFRIENFELNSVLHTGRDKDHWVFRPEDQRHLNVSVTDSNQIKDNES